MKLSFKFFNRNKYKFIILPFFVLLFAAFQVNAVKKKDSKYYPLTIFSKVLAHIQSVYVEDVDIDKLIYGAIKGMVASLDPHSSYLTPDEYKTVKEEVEGKFGGVGIEVDYRFGRLVVISPLPGTPAEKAGVESGDEILAIDGVPVFILSLQDIMRKMRGEPKTTIKLKIRRGEETVYDVELTREIIKIESVEGRLLDKDRKIALIHIKVFQDGTANKVRDLLDAFTAQCKGSLSGLVIDMRNNPGGLLDQSIYVADEFLEKGIILTTRRRADKIIDTEKAHRVGTRSDFEIVLLVNQYTASAAEVLAGALQGNGRASVIGSRTFGKGSIQNIIKLPDKSALKLTTALYATPSGNIIQAKGIEPDFIVPQIKWDPATYDGSAFGEKDLIGHIEEKGKKEGKSATQIMKSFEGDYQLFMAYQYLKAKLKEKSTKDESSGKK